MSDRLRPEMPEPHTPAPIQPCTVFSEEIHLLVDRELGPAETQVVEEHLAGCARCQALAVHLERMSSVLKAWDAQANDVEAPEQRLKHAVLARVAEQSAQRRRDDRMIRVMHLATAAMIVLGLGLGLYLGFTDRPALVVEPEVRISDAPMPLDARTPETFVFEAGGPVEPYAPEDVLAGVETPTLADIEGAEAAAIWDRSVWATQKGDSLAVLVERFQRLEEVETRLGVRVQFWNGPASDKSDPGRDRLITVNALEWLQKRNLLRDWKLARIKASTTKATEPKVVAARSTGVTARTMLVPMPGIDRDLRMLSMRSPAIRVHVPKPTAPGATAAKRKAQPRVLALQAWGLLREKPALASGLDPSRIAFTDPVKAVANRQLHFADSGQGASTVVAIVKDTKLPIYIPAGQFLTGGVADRVIAHPVWLPATRGKKPFIVHCRVVQNYEHGNASEPLVLQREIAGPTIRALLAQGASSRQVKAAAGRLLAAFNGTRGRMLGDWSLYSIHARTHALVMKGVRFSHWERIQGFVVTDAQGRFVGTELVRTGGHASTELLRRLWVSYSVELGHRLTAVARKGDHQEAFAAPSDGLDQVMRRIGSHGATFQTPRGVEQPDGARISHLEVVAAGVNLHALEVAETPAIVSALSSAP